MDFERDARSVKSKGRSAARQDRREICDWMLAPQCHCCCCRQWTDRSRKAEAASKRGGQGQEGLWLWRKQQRRRRQAARDALEIEVVPWKISCFVCLHCTNFIRAWGRTGVEEGSPQGAQLLLVHPHPCAR